MGKQERNKQSEHRCQRSHALSFRNQSCLPKCLQLLSSQQAQFRANLPTHTHKGRCLWTETQSPHAFFILHQGSRVSLHAQSSMSLPQLYPQLQQQGSRGSLSTRNKFATPLLRKRQAQHWDYSHASQALLPLQHTYSHHDYLP